MYEKLRYWLGAEPFLGIFVLAFAVPFALLMAYFVAYGAIEHRWAAAAYAAIWSIAASLSFFATRASERVGKNLKRASRVVLGVGFGTWFLWDDFIPWHGLNSARIASLFVVAVFIWWFVRASERDEEAARLPNYRERDA